ncbi:hypothetical protein [uncultured Agrobacterium sp.]|uniref:hypothetical protein n=1 Tax=uncultured Agrobacterium sp. TaxID=157277 RepID=UPI00260139D8|nr:hypothetical protein [uncultured Agrobacterium sp.]
MSNEFSVTDASRRIFPTLRDTVKQWAFDQSDEFINAGQKPDEATSLVAGILLEVGWIVAGSGAMASGRQPDPAKYLHAAEGALERIKFKELDQENAQ